MQHNYQVVGLLFNVNASNVLGRLNECVCDCHKIVTVMC